MNHFSIEQMETFHDIMTGGYMRDERYVILTAQMQSGKTDVFYLVAFEMLRNKMVEQVYLLCGSSHLDLRKQHRIDDPDMKALYNKYHLFLEKQIGLPTEDVLSMITDIQSRIHVVFGKQTKKTLLPESDFLIIHDESHYAQTKGHLPDKFLQQCGVTLNGDKTAMAQKNIYYLSVSATPISELSQNFHANQGKRIVMMKPGKGYIGVSHYRDRGLIHGFDEWETALAETLVEFALSPCYGIIRIQDAHSAEAKEMAKQYGWDAIEYDGKSNDRSINEMLKKKPERPTLIFIKGLLRMGNRLLKKHIKFVMETSQGSKTDTLLQSLLGRICGYHDNLNIRVYLDNRFLMSGELERYIKMVEDSSDEPLTIPFKANNMLPGANPILSKVSKTGLYDIIPLTLPVKFPTGKDAELRDRIVAEIRCSYETVQSKNSTKQNTAIEKLLLHQETRFHLRRLDGTKYESAYKKLPKAIQEAKAMKIGKSCGTNANEAILWYVECDGLEGLVKGYVYITCLIPVKTESLVIIPRANDNHIFA